MREFLEIQEPDGDYGLCADGKWYLTPRGLAQWMDEEGGLYGLLQRNGGETFIEAGCDSDVVNAFVKAAQDMEDELNRIGAEY